MPSPSPLARCVGLAILFCAFSVPASAHTDDPLARVAALRDQGRWLEALPIVQEELARRPDDPLLYRLNTLLLADLGAAYKAWELYQARPSAFEPEHAQRLQNDYLARLVNWSRALAVDEEARLDEAEDAERRIREYLEHTGTPDARTALRLRLDRLVLLNRLGRYAQLREEVRVLQAEGHVLPGYVLAPVGASLKAAGHPGEAIPFLEAAAAAGGPEASAIRAELAYAWLENEEAGRAIRHLEEWRGQEPAWRRVPGARSPYENWARYDADLTLALVRAYSGLLPEAQQALEEMVAMAPRNAGLQTSLGTVYALRGWPSRSLERHQVAHHLEPNEVSPRLGMIEAWTALQRHDLARPLHDQLLARHPARPDVQRLHRQWRAERGWQVHAWLATGRSRGSDGTSPLGNEDRNAGIEVQGPLLDDRWRAFAWAERTRVDYDTARVDPLWRGAGLRYAFDRLDAELAVGSPGDGLGGTAVAAAAGWRFNDLWRAGVQATRNDRAASSQARAAGITADRVELQGAYRPHERAALDMALGRLRYDDGNRRDFASVAGWHRLATQPTWTVDAVGGLYASRGCRDDAPYFNPARDRSLEAGLRLDQQLWRRYQRHFRHRLTVSASHYRQEGHGSAVVPSVHYLHEWQFGPGRVLEYGVRWSRPVYDGNRERHIGFEAGLHWGQ